MEPATDKIFTAVLQRVPHLLHACVADYIPALRVLRLVSKEASQVALLALRSYTLTLKGKAKDTNVGGVRLLRHTSLSNLSVCLRSTGKFACNNLL